MTTHTKAPRQAHADPISVDPKHYKVEMENDQVRVLRISYGSREKSVMHGHPNSVAIFLTDLHAALQERDVAVDPLQDGGGVRSFTFWDLDGNRLEACQAPAGSAAARSGA